jgi:carboxyl-terminal processing protease
MSCCAFIRSRWLVCSLLTAVVAAGVAIGLARAELAGPKDNEKIISYTIARLMHQKHLSGRLIDDELSKRCFESFIKSLDPMKVYFNRSDIDEFRPLETKLDDQARENGGNVAFAYKVFERFLKRVDERLKYVDEWVKAEHDFTVDEEMITDRDARTFAANDDEARELWRKRIKYDLLQLKAEKKEAEKKTDAEARESIRKRYHGFAKRMKQTDNEELLEIFLTAMTMAYDPHSTYMSAASEEEFKIHLRLNLDGIGAQLSWQDELTVVSNVVPGGAADRDGRLKEKDQIIGVGQGESGEIVDTVGMKLRDVVKLIRGKRGTIVRLKVIPAGKTENTIYNITRDRIVLEESAARSQIFDEKTPDGGSIKVGVIDLPSFYMDMDALRRGDPEYKSTTRDVKKILDDFRAKKVEAVIIDLRRNGGGSLTESINLTGLFIDKGPVVRIKSPDGDVESLDDEDAGVAWNGPLVVMISKLSASASEIFAGAIQDYHRGLIVGDHTTHGKGTVQTMVDLNRPFAFLADRYPKLGSLKLTIQKFYRPSGESTQERGVLSDIELPALTTHMDVGESDLDFALKFDKVPAAVFTPVDFINKEMIDRLKEASEARRAKSADFQKQLTQIDRYKKFKSRKAVPLNEKAFLAQRAELDIDDKDPFEDDEKEKKEKKKKDEVVKRDFYFNEVLSISIDYATAVKAASVAASGLSR